MKKILCICLSLFMAVSLFAEGRTFKKLGKYTDVEILNITWIGIRIKHSTGNLYLKAKDISSLPKADQKLLENEIAIWKQKVEKHNRRVDAKKKNKEEQEKELNEFSAQLPKMNTKTICNWFQKNIGTTPYGSDFKVKFFTTYGYAKNKHKVWNDCSKRLMALDLEDFNALKDKCEGESSIAAINGIIKSKIGVPFTTPKGIHPDFSENLRVRYVWIPKNERVKFVKDLSSKLKCNFCKKEQVMASKSYCKTCQPKVCTKCDNALIDDKDKNNKDKVCAECKGGSGGDAGGDNSGGGDAGGGDAGNDAGGGDSDGGEPL